MTGKTALVTGGAGGIGYETARALAAMGTHVVIAARDNPRGAAAAASLERSEGSGELLPVDMASLESVRQVARRFHAAHRGLDVLVNNAGIAAKTRSLSPDGYELTWATNFLGGFLLTLLLLPALERSAEPRVVNVSSEAHRTTQIRWDDLGFTTGYGGFKAYAQSKLAQVLFTRELARRKPGITVTAVHPGAIATGIWRSTPWLVRAVLGLVLPSSEKGAQPVVRLAADPAMAGSGVSGRYFDRLRQVEPAPQGANDADAARLWTIAEQATGQVLAETV
jgi:NAD(P)-dependent dehydrogenase (short-subunit alcohol dehydrogenase family)